MPAKRTSMRKIRSALRQRALGQSVREIAAALGVGPTTVWDYLGRARRAGLSWPLPEDLDDTELERRLYRRLEERPEVRPLPDWTWIHTELRKRHVTLMLLWQEHKAEHPDAHEYSQFCELYRRWAGSLSVWMRQEHRGGEKLFVDYSGDGIPWFEPATGQHRVAQLFVAALGASNATFACVTATQRLPDWLSAHVKALEFFGGVPTVLVPDQTKTAVSKHCRYDPELNPAYEELAAHYGTCIIPARPSHPKDKAVVEGAVLIAQRWIIAALRNRSFYSLGEINEAIAELLPRLNQKEMRKVGKSRDELFRELDLPALRPLPERRFEIADWAIQVRVGGDYHLRFEQNHYSVPHRYAREEVDVRASERTIEIFHKHGRIASHLRLVGNAQCSTQKEHMPPAHRVEADTTPAKLREHAALIGPAALELVEKIFAQKPRADLGCRSALGVLRLEKDYSRERLEKACHRALGSRSYSRRSVESILKNKLEELPVAQSELEALPAHQDVRGGDYFRSLEEDCA